MYKRKLSALNYPKVDEIKPSTIDQAQFRKIIVWLEENKIRKCKPDVLSHLKNVSSNQWDSNFKKYRNELVCPLQTEELVELLDWFINYAVKQEYMSKKSTYEKHAVENIKSENTPNVTADNPLDHLDFNSKAFIDGIKTIAGMLNIAPHPDPFVTLKAISKLMCTKLTKYAVEHPNEFIVKGKPFPFQDTHSGFNLGDVALNRAAEILRLIYIQDLRDLQTRANELIVAVQAVTANPKTDTKLGKVGI